MNFPNVGSGVSQALNVKTLITVLIIFFIVTMVMQYLIKESVELYNVTTGEHVLTGKVKPVVTFMTKKA